ncbi:MBL fold metallo-hydrolase [Patulibacter defluvii]|uniref:MBL fold metallo-hydrolase n=1 Tax=Patulibacter defluvii TaxID=3095358 RepID=UPI002A764212|nr:MBL fold metallo-hydrolase [Patulibacter sp. DM4]
MSARLSQLTDREREALDAARELGIHRLPLPTPFAIGDVNVYLVEGDPLTLVDCGPNAATSLDVLEAGLATLGHRLDDVEQLLITHQHLDHIGLAATLAHRSGAPVTCLDLLAPVLEDWLTFSAEDDDDARQLMLRHGVEPHVADALRAVARLVQHWGAPVAVDRRLTVGETVTLDGHGFAVLHRPGHSPSDTLFHDPARRLAICGDHLLAKVSSNALIQRPLDGSWDGRRPQPLLQYRRSLLATRELEIEIGLGGHGGPVTDHRTLIDDRIRHQDRRAEQLLSLLTHGPRSAHQLATTMWGDIAVTQAFLTLSEVLGHLDLLLEAGTVVEDDSAEVVRFEAA